MRQPNSQKGQGLFETVLALPLLLTVGFLLCLLVYRGWFYYLADYHLHESLLCTDTHTTSSCKTELENRLKKFVLKKNKIHIQLNKSRSFAYGKISLDLNPPLIIEKKYTRFSL